MTTDQFLPDRHSVRSIVGHPGLTADQFIARAYPLESLLSTLIRHLLGIQLTAIRPAKSLHCNTALPRPFLEARFCPILRNNHISVK